MFKPQEYWINVYKDEAQYHFTMQSTLNDLANCVRRGEITDYIHTLHRAPEFHRFVDVIDLQQEAEDEIAREDVGYNARPE
jgi:hypothetical protein